VAYIIHLETSTKACSVALSSSGKLLDFTTESTDSYAHSERLNSIISDLLKRNKVWFEDLSAVSISSGPGSYTGLRIGVSTAKGLCFALEIPMIAIDSLSALAYFSKHQNIEFSNLILTAIDARRMEAYTALFDSHLYVVKPVSADIFSEDYLSEIYDNISIMVVGDAQEKCLEIWKHRKNIKFSSISSDARGQIEPAYKKFVNQDFSDLVYFEPAYFKDFQPGVKSK